MAVIRESVRVVKLARVENLSFEKRQREKEKRQTEKERLEIGE